MMTDKILISSPAREGMKKGIKIGFYVSLVYNLASPFIYFFTDPSVHKAGTPIGGVISFMMVLPLCGLLVGCVPATIVGGLTGWVVGKVFALLQSRLTPARALLIGLGVAISISLLLNWAIVFDARQPSPLLWNDMYIFFLGIPTLVYIATSLVASYRLYQAVTK
jgi:hypothetical protein